MCLVFLTSLAVVFEKGEDYNSVASFYSVRKGTHHLWLIYTTFFERQQKQINKYKTFIQKKMLSSILQTPNLATQFGREQIQIAECQPSLTQTSKQVKIIFHEFLWQILEIWVPSLLFHYRLKYKNFLNI